MKRRDFIKKSAVAGGGTAAMSSIPLLSAVPVSTWKPLKMSGKVVNVDMSSPKYKQINTQEVTAFEPPSDDGFIGNIGNMVAGGGALHNGREAEMRPCLYG